MLLRYIGMAFICKTLGLTHNLVMDGSTKHLILLDMPVGESTYRLPKSSPDLLQRNLNFSFLLPSNIELTTQPAPY